MRFPLRGSLKLCRVPRMLSALSRFIKLCWDVCTQIASVQASATELIRPAGVPPCGGAGGGTQVWQTRFICTFSSRQHRGPLGVCRDT